MGESFSPALFSRDVNNYFELGTNISYSEIWCRFQRQASSLVMMLCYERSLTYIFVLQSFIYSFIYWCVRVFSCLLVCGSLYLYTAFVSIRMQILISSVLATDSYILIERSLAIMLILIMSWCHCIRCSLLSKCDDKPFSILIFRMYIFINSEILLDDMWKLIYIYSYINFIRSLIY